jgi:hypothetical protein
MHHLAYHSLLAAAHDTPDDGRCDVPNMSRWWCNYLNYKIKHMCIKLVITNWWNILSGTDLQLQTRAACESTYDDKHLFHSGSCQTGESSQVRIDRSWYPQCCLDSSGTLHLLCRSHGCPTSGAPCPLQHHKCTPPCVQNNCMLKNKVTVKLVLLFPNKRLGKAHQCFNVTVTWIILGNKAINISIINICC